MKPSFSRYLMLVVVATMLTASVSVFAQTDSPKSNSVEWLTYADPRFDFSIKYPSDWEVIPRDDSDPNAVSGLLVFAPVAAPDNIDINDPHEFGPHIIVGHYLAELEDGQSLSEWTEIYESLGHESDRASIQRQPRRVFRIHGARAVHEEGVSPLTTYQFTNLAHKNMVWDIWTNIPSTDPYAAVYNRMVRSFRFGRNSPANLRAAYGSDIVPMDMEEILRMSSEEQTAGFQDLTNPTGQQDPQITDLTDTWKSPVLNSCYALT